jgi:hypothetical protein
MTRIVTLSLQAPAAPEEGCGAGRAGDRRHPAEAGPQGRTSSGGGGRPGALGIEHISSSETVHIVTVRRRGRRFADVPDMTPEEHRRVGDLADAL